MHKWFGDRISRLCFCQVKRQRSVLALTPESSTVDPTLSMVLPPQLETSHLSSEVGCLPRSVFALKTSLPSTG